MPDAPSLYRDDYYAWTQDQAAKLRSWPEHLRPNGIDAGTLAEEVEDLGRSVEDAVESTLEQLVIHLLNLELHPDPQPRNHRANEVDAFRARLERLFRRNPALKARRHAIYAGLWPSACRQVGKALARDGANAPALTAALREDTLRHLLDEAVLNEDWYPQPAG